jgi:hypothetical protein
MDRRRYARCSVEHANTPATRHSMYPRSATRSIPRNAPQAVAHRVSAAGPQVLHTNSTANADLCDFRGREFATCADESQRSRRARDSSNFPPSSPGVRAVETPHFRPMRTQTAAPCFDSNLPDSDCGLAASAESPFPERRSSIDGRAACEPRGRASQPLATPHLHRARNALTARLARDPVPPSSRRVPFAPDRSPLPRTPTASGVSFHWSTSGRAEPSTLHDDPQG